MGTQQKRHLAVRFGIGLGIEIIVLLAVLGVASVIVVRRALVKEFIGSTQTLLDSQANYLVMRNSKFMQQLRMYTMSDVVAPDVTTEEIVAWLVAHRRIRSGDFESVMYCDYETGLAYTDEGAKLDVSGTEYFNALKNTDKNQYISNPVGTSKEDSQYFVCKQVSANKKNIGFFACGVSLKKLAEAVDKVKIGEAGYAFLLDGDGTVMAYPDDSLVMRSNFATDAGARGGLSAIAKQMAAHESGFGWVQGLSRRELVVYQPFNGTNWAMALAVPQNQVFRTSDQLAVVVVVLIIVITVILIATSMFRIIRSLKPLKRVDKAIHAIAQGNADLSRRLEVKVNNEIGSVTDGFNRFMEKLQTIVSDIKASKAELKSSGAEMHQNTTDTVGAINQILGNITSVTSQIKQQSSSVVETASAVEQIAQNIAALERMIGAQSEGVSQASASVVQMIGNIDSVNLSVSKMSASFNELEQNARSGAEKQNNVNKRIEQIVAESKMLQEANKTIASIASQTNLLAMNAAIEAAHAGEQGKGFAVVADEIRKLSETSGAQSKTIGEQLRKIGESIAEVVSASEESTRTFNAVVESIKATDGIVAEIKTTLDEQTQGSRQINAALRNMNSSTAEVRAAAADMSEGNKAILAEVKRLQDATGAIEDSVNEMSHGAARINETGDSLGAISGKMNRAIDRIDEQIDQFSI